MKSYNVKLNTILIIIVCLLLTTGTFAHDSRRPKFFPRIYNNGDNIEFPFERTYQDAPLFLHALLNYDFHPLWHYEWEKNLFSRNNLRMSTGSVTTAELLVESQLFLNNDLSDGFWFHSRGFWSSNRHQNKRVLTIFLGLEKLVYKENLTLFILAHPRFEKEYLGVQLGFSVYGNDRQNYLNIGLVLEDLVYDKKNDRNGKTLKKPRGLQWFMRYGKNKWWIYSDGNLNTGFKRKYPDIGNLIVENFHQQQINNVNLKLYYKTDVSTLFMVNFYHYHFTEEKTYEAYQNNYNYKNNIYDVSIQYFFPLKERIRFRLATHYVIQKAKSVGYSQHKYKRQEILPAVFFDYLWIKHQIELGYMFTLQSWEYNSINSVYDFNLENGYFDKIYLGYKYHFNPNAILHLSISHQLNVRGFGGGNIQYLMFF
jgi:hypothetical protein